MSNGDMVGKEFFSFEEGLLQFEPPLPGCILFLSFFFFSLSWFSGKFRLVSISSYIVNVILKIDDKKEHDSGDGGRSLPVLV